MVAKHGLKVECIKNYIVGLKIHFDTMIVTRVITLTIIYIGNKNCRWAFDK